LLRFNVEKSILSVIIIGTSLFIIFQEIAIYINEVFGLPIFRNIIYPIAGLSFCFISISLFLCSSHLFSKIGKVTSAPIEPPELLVAEGLHRFTRNPIYIGHILAIVGEFLIFSISYCFLCFKCHIFCTFLCCINRRTSSKKKIWSTIRYLYENCSQMDSQKIIIKPVS